MLAWLASASLGCTLITDVDRSLIPEPEQPTLPEVDAGNHPPISEDASVPDAGAPEDAGAGDAGDAGDAATPAE